MPLTQGSYYFSFYSFWLPGVSLSISSKFGPNCFAKSRVHAGTMSMGRETNGLKPVLRYKYFSQTLNTTFLSTCFGFQECHCRFLQNPGPIVSLSHAYALVQCLRVAKQTALNLYPRLSSVNLILLPKETSEKKESSVGEPLAKFRSILSVSETDTIWSKENKKRKKRFQWGNHLQNSDRSFQLVELIPHVRKKIKLKKGELSGGTS